MPILLLIFWPLLLWGVEAKYWGEEIPGVCTRFVPTGKEIALTLDACGGGVRGNGYDADLIEYLKRHKIKATLFLNRRWVEANRELAMKLASDPLFEIENHGTNHKPLSCCGRSVYGITGTTSLREVEEEVMGNHEMIRRLLGKEMRFFRSGTAYYDELALARVEALGYRAVGFSVVADEGATLKAKDVAKRLLSVRPGDIVIAHMNHPEGQTAEGFIEALEILRANGWRFVRLDEVLP